MDRVTSTDPQRAAAPADPSAAAAPRTNRMPGNWRSLVISMVIMTTVVFVAVSLMPHPAQRERTTVDLARAATQLAAQRHWPLATASTGDDWHPTTVSLTSDDKGVPTWRVGYHHRPGDDRYVELTQTKPGEPVSADQLAAWISRETKGGRQDGTAVVGGVTWSRRTAAVESGADRVRRSLVAQGADAPGGLATVISGEVDYADLEGFAGSLRLQQVRAATGDATGQASSGSSGSPSSGSSSSAPSVSSAP